MYADSGARTSKWEKKQTIPLEIRARSTFSEVLSLRRSVSSLQTGNQKLFDRFWLA